MKRSLKKIRNKFEQGHPVLGEYPQIVKLLSKPGNAKSRSFAYKAKKRELEKNKTIND